MSLIAEFSKCLAAVSHYRAGFDFEMSRAQRADEKKDGDAAMTRARAIWRENPAMQDDLRAAFAAAKPLMTFDEVTK